MNGLGITQLAYQPRLAIAHDALVYRGGAERVVAALHTRWPAVPIYTSAYLPEATFEVFQHADVRTSFVQRLARDPQTVMRRVFPLMIPGFWSFNLSQYDVVLSSAAYAAKAIRVPRSTCHLCYCYSPLRLAWRPFDYVSENTAVTMRLTLRMVASVLRRWDFRVAQGVDSFATTCRNVAKRIYECYRREAEVIPAPIELARYSVAPAPDQYYLIVSRLNAYKRVDLAIRAFNELQRPLWIVGSGPQQAEFKRLAMENVRFLGTVSDEDILSLYAHCRALIFPQEEDYGLAPLEAQASGRPVIAFGAGGALETILDSETGLFFTEQSVDALVSAVREADRMHFEPLRIRQHAAQYDVTAFCDRMAAFVETKWRAFPDYEGRAYARLDKQA